MRFFNQLGLAILTIGVLTSGAWGSTNWSGKLSFNSSEIPDPNSPNSQQLIAAQLAAQQQTAIKLTLKDNHKFTIVTSVGSVSTTVTGKWSQNGYAVTISPQPGTSRTFTLSRDGKAMTYTQGMLTITFKR